jgi:hypothetical protein
MVNFLFLSWRVVCHLTVFEAGNYEAAVESSNSAAAITSVLYPNDHTSVIISNPVI